MTNVFGELRRWTAAGEAAALATLVRVEESAPQRPGARMAVSASGRIAGSVSGGCVEGDVVSRALRVIESGTPDLARYQRADPDGLEIGLGCGGRIEVLIERADDDAWRAIDAALAGGPAFVLCIALAPERLRGRKLLAFAGGEVRGSIATEVDARVARLARTRAGREDTEIVEIAAPGGPVSVFLEPVRSAPRLFLVGATDTAVSLSRLAKTLGYRVWVIDPRSAFLTPERFPDADVCMSEWPESAFERAGGLDPRDALVTLTHDPKIDLPALECGLRRPVAYLGALGSRSTHASRCAALRERGFDDAALARIHAPVGLDLGARVPAEIALAVLAEMIAVRNGSDARPLVEGSGRIHARSAADPDRARR